MRLMLSYRSAPAVSQMPSVQERPATSTFLEPKAAPTVAVTLYLKLSWRYLSTRHVFPTLCCPSSTILMSTFAEDAIGSSVCVVWGLGRVAQPPPCRAGRLGFFCGCEIK